MPFIWPALSTPPDLQRWPASSPSAAARYRELQQQRAHQAIRGVDASADEALALCCVEWCCVEDRCPVRSTAPGLDVIRGLDVAEAYGPPQAKLESAHGAAGLLDFGGDAVGASRGY